MNPGSSLRSWAGRRLLSASAGKTTGLAGISVLPRNMRRPLQRVGVDPLPQLAKMRAEATVKKLRKVFGVNVWLVSGYDDVKAVLGDGTAFSTDIRPILGMDAGVTIGGLGFTDPPEHTRLRKILTPQFTMRALMRLQPQIDAVIAQRLDVLEAKHVAGEPIDLVQDFAFPIPVLVISELLGLPLEDRERFRSLGHARFDVLGGGAGTFGAMSESREFLQELITRQRRDPGPGLLGYLVREHGDEIDDDELAGLADGVFVGGYETSASMLSLGALTLLRDRPSYLRAATDDVDDVVEELLRYLSVVQIAFPRFAKEDMVVGGQQISKGDALICSLIGADRDPVLGEHVNRLDPSKATRSHMAFGHGFHRCVGAELARLELRSAFRGLATRYPDLQLACDVNDLQFRKLSIVFGIEALPVRLQAERRASA